MTCHFKLKLSVVTAAGFILVSPASFAASDGALGATSTGTAVVTLNLGEVFQISNMNDLSLGSYGGAGDLSGNDDICVYHNGDGSYQVTVTDDSGLSPAAYGVQDSLDANLIDMDVRWNNTTGTVGNSLLTYNTPLITTGANNLATDCSVGGLTANLEVILQEADLQAAPAGAYDSTLTVTIDPD